MIEKFLSFDINIFRIIKLSRILLFIGVLVSMVWAGYFSSKILIIPHQLTYLEGAASVQTWFFLNLENPFSLENHPIGTNNYGAVYSLIVLPFAALFGNTLFIHRVVTLGFTILTALLTFTVIFHTKKDFIIAAICSSFIVISLIGQQGMGGISAYPSVTGVFFYMTAILVPMAWSFNKRSLFISILATLAGFYTKPYFLLSFGIVFLYIFLFLSPKRGLFYGFFFSGIFLSSIFIVKRIFPMYFIDVIWGNIFNTSKSLYHMVEQILDLVITFLPILILALLNLIKKQKKTKTEKLNFRLSLNQPLLKNPPNYFSHSFLVSLAAFVSVLGWHVLNQYGYAYQLVLPLFFCWIFGGVVTPNRTNLFFALLVLINLFSWEKITISPEYLQEKSPNEWNKIIYYLDDAKSILHPPLIASDIISLGLPPVDSGHTIMFYNILPYPNTILADIPYEKIRRDGYAFTNIINRRIENQKYDLVITIKNKAAFFDGWILQQNYTLVDEINIEMSMGGIYTLQVWKPNP